MSVGVCALLVTATSASAQTLQQRINRAVGASGLSATTSVVVFDVARQQVVYSHQQRRTVTPASNQKLYTGAALLAALGPGHRFQTTVALRGTQTGTRFTGDIYLIGGGDPTLSTPEFARRNFRGLGANIGLLTIPLRERGIRRITGRLIVDDDFLSRQRYVGSWSARYRYDEASALGALTVNQSYYGPRLYVGSSSRRPELYAGEVYRGLLRKHGIRITGATVAGNTPRSAERVGLVESPPLRTIVRFMTRISDNFTAEILIRDLGAIKGGAGTTERGIREARKQLATLGVPLAGVRITDGSGLAASNRTTSRNIADLLNIVDQHATLGVPFRASLAISGGWGTLEDRLDRAPYRGRVIAKTGTVNQASALSGFATRSNGSRYGFATVTYAGGGVNWTRSRRLQDNIAAILVR